MKKILLSAALVINAFCALAQQKTIKLKFDPDGEFKIAQFTDMHIGHDMEKAQIVADMMNEVLNSEKPDLVIFTGDITTLNEVELAWEQIAKILAKKEIPWTAVLGNHDDEYDVSRKDIIDIIAKQPYCIMREMATDIKGEGNHVLPVYNKSGNHVEALVYCFDSNAYSGIKQVKGYGWFDSSQLGWYEKQSQRYTKQNNGEPLPALAFFHIPLPEYTQAWESFETKRYGDRNEKECPPNINTGMFAKMLECGDIMGTFAGHDHVNDYIATLYNVALAYGRASGGGNTYGDKTPGSRIIILKEGKREFDTYIREKDNQNKLFNCTYPTSFEKKK